jgi:zinc transport system permease protein
VLVGALLIIPAAAARAVATSLRGFFVLSMLFAVTAAVSGILIPMQFDLPVPSGAAIILAAGILFLLASLARPALPAFRGGAA